MFFLPIYCILISGTARYCTLLDTQCLEKNRGNVFNKKQYELHIVPK